MEVKVNKRLRQRSLRMHFNDKGQLVISCPLCTAQSEINNFIEKNYDWIQKQSHKFVSHTYKTGDTFPLFGKECLLTLGQSSRNSVSEYQGNITLLLPHPEDQEKVKKVLLSFYKQRLLEYVKPRLEQLCITMKINIPQVQISNAKTTWGVCYSKKNLVKFSAITACLEEDLIDMIIAHELCHFKYQNHSPLFWKEVSKYVPGLEQKKSRLRQMSKTGICRNLF